jgi:phosphoenolpyruvate carboxykinase (GTP)
MTTKNAQLLKWVSEVQALTQPSKVVWCDGSKEEYNSITHQMVESGDFIKLNEKTYPNCFLHRSDPSDVARTEHLTFVCTPNQADAGPNNNWKEPATAHKEIDELFAGCMKGRTMYVIPYCMGPISSKFSKCGVEITDSPYVVANMHIMTRMGKSALERIEKENVFVRGLHSTGDLKVEHRKIMHFPTELLIKSIGSGYGGNALLGKKCHALRIASWQSKNEGWLAEHMLIVGIENPKGERKYIAAAFPSACGKTNLAMLIPPPSYKGWKVWTVGDDIAWLHPGEDGRLYAINPEAGYFGVAPGTSESTNPTALRMLNRNCIFTNVGLTADGEPWWEGKDNKVPAYDWQGRPYNKDNGPAAHPNSRFTVPASQCESYAPEAENPAGVPISAIVFGGRRSTLVPLVFEAFSWAHGVLIGASVGSQTTAAATGKVGVMRRDPMAMQPFAGYNFGDYWAHWLSLEKTSKHLPKIFHVNWFRQNKNGKFIWPGFGDNMRVLKWILERCEGKVDARKTAIGNLPLPGDLDISGIELDQSTLTELLTVDNVGYKAEMASITDYLKSFGDRLPSNLLDEQKKIIAELN